MSSLQHHSVHYSSMICSILAVKYVAFLTKHLVYIKGTTTANPTLQSLKYFLSFNQSHCSYHTIIKIYAKLKQKQLQYPSSSTLKSVRCQNTKAQIASTRALSHLLAITVALFIEIIKNTYMSKISHCNNKCTQQSYRQAENSHIQTVQSRALSHVFTKAAVLTLKLLV